MRILLSDQGCSCAGRRAPVPPSTPAPPSSASTAIVAPECGAVPWAPGSVRSSRRDTPESALVTDLSGPGLPRATCTAPIGGHSILCVSSVKRYTRRRNHALFRVRRCVALSAGPKARPVGSSALRVATRYPVAVRSAELKTRPHRRFARTVAPRSLVTRHLPLPAHLKLRQRLPRFASRRSSQMLRRRSRASARRSRRCSPTSRGQPN